MALINCIECNKEISDKAHNCPNCGFPLTKPDLLKEELKFPDLPKDLNIGKAIVNWGGDSAFSGIYAANENINTNIPSGKVTVMLHTHGIDILSSYISVLKIHNSQIISIKKTSRSELVKIDKSVIGRAFIGGLILGPLGAVIGGMSGMGSKESLSDKSYLIINYWDIESRAAQTLLIGGDPKKIQLLIDRNKKESEINQAQSRKAEKPKGCAVIGILLFLWAACGSMVLGIITR